MNKINDNLYTFEGQQDIVSPQLVYYPAIIRENIRKMIDIAGGASSAPPSPRLKWPPRPVRST